MSCELKSKRYRITKNIEEPKKNKQKIRTLNKLEAASDDLCVDLKKII